jgi:hypothetical protein
MYLTPKYWENIVKSTNNIIAMNMN